MNVFGHIEIGSAEEIAAASVSQPNEPKVVREMREIVASMTPRNRAEAYHDAAAKKEEALQMFKLGILGLEERAVVESLFWTLVRGIADLNRGKKRLPRETKDLGDKIADQYMANFSLFQSAPDHWAFDQLFPIVPLHRLGRGARPATPPSWTSPATRTGRSTGSSRGTGWTRRSRCTRSSPASRTTWACS